MKNLLFLYLCLTLTGCAFFRPTAQFFIINDSQDKKSVDIQIKMGGKIVFADTIRYTNVRPDLQYTPSITLEKGKYVIYVNADSGKAFLRQPIMLDGNRWIFISYSYKKPIDSLRKEDPVKNFGFDTSCINQKLRDTLPTVSINVLTEEPVLL